MEYSICSIVLSAVDAVIATSAAGVIVVTSSPSFNYKDIAVFSLLE